MKEISLSYSEAYHFHEIRHGPMSMVDQSAMIVGFVSPASAGSSIRVLEDMVGLGASAVVVGPRVTDEGVNVAGWIETPDDFPTPWQSVFYLPFAQLLALERGRAKGLDADNPRNLEAVVREI